jgi:hypothetical protein
MLKQTLPYGHPHLEPIMTVLQKKGVTVLTLINGEKWATTSLKPFEVCHALYTQQKTSEKDLLYPCFL